MAMFDIRPAKSGSLDLEKLRGIKKKIDLRPEITASEVETANFFDEYPSQKTAGSDEGEFIFEIPKEIKPQPLLPAPKSGKPNRKAIEIPRQSILEEFHKAMAESTGVVAELTKFGAEIYPLKKQSANPVTHTNVRYRANWRKTKFIRREADVPEEPQATAAIAEAVDVERDKNLENFWKPAGSFSSPVSREMEAYLEKGKIENRLHTHIADKKERFKPAYQRTKPKWNSWFRRRSFVFLAIIGLSVAGAFGFVQKSGILAKNNVIQNGNNAVANLKEAKQDLENFDFLKAADSFALAYDDFSKASGTLSQLGASFLSIFGNIPGLDKVKAANNLVEAGQNMSKAGENLSLAFATLYKSNLFSSFGSSVPNNGSLGKTIREFKDVLEYADKNINKAASLLAVIDANVLPEDKRQTLVDFKEKIPAFQKYIGEAIDYSKFMYDFVGSNGHRRYLVLLQNNSELRPTGGFPGTYAVIEFENGNLKKTFVDDIYQIDGGIRENIIPPIPLQHITPTWGMRDANWFADFPASARKVEEFFKLEGGGEVDGVITITPDIITKILAVVGPIDMPEYKMELTADNFLTQVQEEVEYKADRSKPKKILSDFQPKFLAKLAEQNRDGWIAIFKILLNGLKEKHALAYFNNQELQKLAVENGFAGEIKRVPADYLQVVFSNVKGSKTDFVTDNSFNLKISPNNGGDLTHELTIARTHKGGNSKFGFYNKDNSAYIRVYVPLGAKLEEIKGQSITNFDALIGYEDFDFKIDKDLESIESGISHPMSGVDVFEESGRTVFGFWLITKPGQTKSVTLKYSVTEETAAPNGKFSLYWQKQSGTGSDLAQIDYRGKVEQFDLSVDREFAVEK